MDGIGQNLARLGAVTAGHSLNLSSYFGRLAP
jgi:hypothetical protein